MRRGFHAKFIRPLRFVSGYHFQVRTLFSMLQALPTIMIQSWSVGVLGTSGAKALHTSNEVQCPAIHGLQALCEVLLPLLNLVGAYLWP